MRIKNFLPILFGMGVLLSSGSYVLAVECTPVPTSSQANKLLGYYTEDGHNYISNGRIVTGKGPLWNCGGVFVSNDFKEKYVCKNANSSLFLTACTNNSTGDLNSCQPLPDKSWSWYCGDGTPGGHSCDSSYPSYGTQTWCGYTIAKV